MVPINVTMDRNMPYGENAYVKKMSRKQSKGGPVDLSHDSDLILGLVTDSLVGDTALERLVLEINAKEAAPSRISNGKDKATMAQKR